MRKSVYYPIDQFILKLKSDREIEQLKREERDDHLDIIVLSLTGVLVFALVSAIAVIFMESMYS